jgi:hypothetical protein
MTSTGAKTYTLPHDPLTPLDPTMRPTAHTIRLLCRELYANAQSVESRLGGGEHGHLGMIMPDYEYILISNNGEAYEPPEMPAVVIYAGTAINRDQQKADYTEAADRYFETRSLQGQLQKLIIQATPLRYIKKLAQGTRGFANVTPAGLLQHLITNYGTIKRKDLEDNLQRIKTPWNPDTPIEDVFNNGEECRELATDGQDPITDMAYLRILLTIFRQSGVMDIAFQHWDIMPEATQTLELAIEHFTNADLARMESKEYLKEILAANPAIQAKSNALPPPPGARTRTQWPPDGTLDGFHYCWTHGITSHPGAHCLYPADGHIPDATLKNRKGGATTAQVGRPANFGRKNQPSREQATKRKANSDPASRTKEGR